MKTYTVIRNVRSRDKWNWDRIERQVRILPLPGESDRETARRAMKTVFPFFTQKTFVYSLSEDKEYTFRPN